MSASLHPLVSQYLARHHLQEAARTDGRATVLVDERWRVHLQGTAHGGVAITARLCALPEAGAGRDTWLEQLGRDALGMLREHPSGCVIDPREESLWLQQMVGSDADNQGLDEAVGQFANALSYWTAALRRAA